MNPHWRSVALALIAGAALAACGGRDGDQSSEIKHSNSVSFGVSLSAVGTDGATTIKALGGAQDTATATAAATATATATANAAVTAAQGLVQRLASTLNEQLAKA